MRIACIAPAFPYRGGISHFSVRLVRELKLHNESLFINFSRLYPDILFPGRTQLDVSSKKIDLETERLIDSVRPSSWKRAARRICEWGADVVLFHWWHPFFGPAFRSIAQHLGQNVTKVAICHNVVPHEKGALWRSAVRFGLNRMDGYIVHGKSETHVLDRLFPDKPALTAFHPIYDVFEGMDISQSDTRKQLGLDKNSDYILYFGLIRPYKGVEVLLEACRYIKDISTIKVLIVGEIYSGGENIRTLINQLPTGQVRLVDQYIPNEEVTLWFRAADIVVLPYISATQSGVVPIAYQCNRPVIVTRVGGLPDVVQDGKSGYLVEPGDPVELAEAIRRHFIEFNKPDMTAGIGRMVQRLSWSTYAQELIKFIEYLKSKR